MISQRIALVLMIFWQLAVFGASSVPQEGQDRIGVAAPEFKFAALGELASIRDRKT